MTRPVVLASIFACAGARRLHADMESASAVQVVDNIASLLNRQDDGLRRIAQEAVAQATPGAEGHFKASLKKVLDKIDGHLQPKVKEAQADVQEKIDDAFAAIEVANAEAVDAKIAADKADSAWFDCVTREVEMKQFHETWEEKLENAKAAEKEACTKQQENSGFKFAVGDKSKFAFKCDNEVDGSCEQQMEAFKRHTQKTLKDAREKLQANQRYYDDLEKDCKANKEATIAARRATASADARHESHQDKCESMKLDRTKKICEYGDTVQAKGEDEAAFKKLIASVEGSGTEDSESDRQQEWKTLVTSSCMIAKSIEKGFSGPVDASDLQACSAETKELGKLNKNADKVNALTKSHANVAGPISFSTGQDLDLYIKKEASTPDFNPRAGQPPFKMCPQENEDIWRPVVNDKLKARSQKPTAQAR